MKDLVQQLERAFWRHLPKTIATQVLTGDQKPPSLDGVTFAKLLFDPVIGQMIVETGQNDMHGQP